MKDLQEILNVWGAWRAKHLKTECKFVTADQYGKHSELNDYRAKECTTKTGDIVYSDNAKPGRHANTVYSNEFENHLDVACTEHFKKVQETKTAFEWQVTESVKLGSSVSAKVKVPEVAEVSASVSVELGLSSTQAISISSTETWEFSVDVPVPPKSTVELTIVVDTAAYEMRFRQDVLLTGDVAIWFKDKVKWSSSSKDKHNLYFVPIDNVLREVQMNNLIDATGYELRGKRQIAAVAQGVFTGDQNIKARVKVGAKTLQEVDEPKKASKFN